MFLPLAAHSGDYPKARLSILPVPTPQTLLPSSERPFPSAFLGQGAFFAFGRYALAEALRRTEVGPGRAVLLPAFHCRTMVEPALSLGAEVRFYPLRADLEPDFDALAALAADGKAAALLLTHYFGFANDLTRAEAFCAAHGIALIEDCAHAFYGEHEGRILGTVGRYASASAWKFLPTRDGAVLRDNAADSPIELTPPGPLSELKAAAGMLESALGRRRGPLPSPALAAPDWVGQAGVIAARARQAKVAAPGSSAFQPTSANMAGLRLSRWLMRHAAHARIADKRREHYRRWLAGLSGVAGVQALYPRLPDGIVPYAFPLLTDREGLVFHALKLAGIPMWRWEDMARTDCPIALEYRLRLLQLPCHQGLTEAELDWMIEVVRAVMARMSA